jgi:hypothetical protein
MKDKTTVVNRRKESYDVYIGRGSKWGNPFKIGEDGTREQVINKYDKWIRQQPALLNDLHELKSKRLGCYCAPLSCHGHVLVELIEELLPDDGQS